MHTVTGGSWETPDLMHVQLDVVPYPVLHMYGILAPAEGHSSAPKSWPVVYNFDLYSRLAPPSPPSLTVCPQILQVELHNDLEDEEEKENETAQTQTPTPRGEGDPDSIPRATLNRFVRFV